MKRLVVIGLLLFAASTALADDWPAYRGPNRDGVSKETGLLKDWPKAGPPLAWTFKNAGVGYSGPAIVGDRIYLMGGRGDTEYVFALDAKDGHEIWATKIGPLYSEKANTWNAGPSATPTVDNGLVYALGGQGNLVCVNAADGSLRWQKSMPADFKGEVDNAGFKEHTDIIGWGYTWSPLVDGDNLIITPGGPGGLAAALDKKTGDLKWRSSEVKEQCTYASPVVTDAGGVRQYVVQSHSGPYGVAAKDGRLLWHHALKQTDVVIPTPLVSGSLVYVTVAPDNGCELLSLAADGDKITAKKVYGNRNMKNYVGGVVLVDGNVYGSWKGGRWVCQNLKTGKAAWEERRALEEGAVVAADGQLFCYGERDGALVVIDASPAGWKERARFSAPEKSTKNKPSGRIWTPPVIANGKLYLRDQELFVCFDIKAK